MLRIFLACNLNCTPVVMAKHRHPCVHFLGISTCGRSSRDCFTSTASTVTVTEVRNSVQHIFTRLHYYKQQLQPFTTTWHNKICCLWLVRTSTTKFVGDVGYRMAKKLIGLYKETIFMNNDIKFINIEWRTPYPLTNFKDCFGFNASLIFFLLFFFNMCGFLFIWTLASYQTVVVNWQNLLFILFH